MAKYVLNNVVTYRVGTVAEVEALHDELSADGRFQLSQFSYQTKYVKEKKEIVDEYQVVKAKLVFNEEKTPDTDIEIDYKVEF